MPELTAFFHYKRIVRTYSGEKSGLVVSLEIGKAASGDSFFDWPLTTGH
jgi:hypothetical protein